MADDMTLKSTVRLDTKAAESRIKQLSAATDKMFSRMSSPMGAGAGIGRIGSQLVSGVGMFASALTGAFSQAFSQAATLAKSLLAGAVAFGGALAAAVYGAHKAMSPAAEFERYRAQLANMGKMDNLGLYRKTATEGPQDVAQVVRAAVQLESFGIDTGNERYLKAVQDASAMFGRDMSEVAGILAKVSGGVLEQEQLLMVGLTKRDLGRQGIEVGKSGAVAEGSKGGLLEALIKAMEERSGGMAKAMANTYEGAVSNLFDAIKSGFADGLESMLGYATIAVQTATAAVQDIGKAFANVDWSRAGQTLVTLAQTAATTIKSVDWKSVGDTFAGIAADALALANALFSEEGRTKLLDGLGKVLEAAVLDMNTVIGNSLLSLELVLKEGWNAFSSSVLPELSAGIFHAMWKAFSTGAGMLIKIAEWLATAIGTVVSKIPGIGRGVNMDNMHNAAAGLQEAFGWDSKSTLDELSEARQRSLELDRQRLEKQRGAGLQTPKAISEMLAGLGGGNTEAAETVAEREKARQEANKKAEEAAKLRKEAEEKAAREKERQEEERRHRQMMLVQSQMLQEFKSLSQIAQADLAASMII